MKASLALLVILAGALTAWAQEEEKTYLDPACMKDYFYKSLEACLVDPPTCDTCTCPRLKSECSDAAGWASGAELNNEACCKRKDPLERCNLFFNLHLAMGRESRK